MKKQSINRQWLFKSSVTCTKSEWEQAKGTTVDLPHDFSITQKRDPHTAAGWSNGYFPGGVGIYEKSLFVPDNWRGKKVLLEFEGVYMNTTVHFNNQMVAQHPYGYTSFHCDVTPYLTFGAANQIKVTVNNNALPNTRWYSGSGIYRPVWLMVGELVHIVPWGIFAATPKVSAESSVVSVKTQIENSGSTRANVLLRTSLYDQQGSKVAETESSIEISEKGNLESSLSLSVSPAHLWSLENPYLYTLKSELLQDGRVMDTHEIKIGIRSISFDVKNGFQLNGTNVKMKGGCVHHDCGLLGAAAYDRAEERKVELLLQSGYNAVRCAHNPPSPAFLDACDRLGMLVIDEAFDCWREAKRPNDYGKYFEDWWQRDMASMILRDRNHPSIVMWSTGNEIPERCGHSEGYVYARKLAELVRSLDNTRAVTNALHPRAVSPARDDFVAPLDVVGYNYMLALYETDGKKFPDRLICGTETFPKEAFDYWDAVEHLSYVIGDFVWTSLDYLGEAGTGQVRYNDEKTLPGAYPWHQAFCGDIDICGFKRPQSYYRDCIWGISKAPYIAVYKPEYYGKEAVISGWGWPNVLSSWSWPGFEKNPIVIDVYSCSDEIELRLNGQSLGRKKAGKFNRYTASFETTYTPGILTAVAYEAGTEISRTVLKTAGVPVSIRLTPDRSGISAAFGDLSFVTVELLDVAGNVVHNADNLLFFTTSGTGSLIAVGSGNPVSDEMYVGNQRRVHEGRAMVVLRSSGAGGEIKLHASAEGIPAAVCSVTTK